jgi:hypothetical protein
MTTNNVADHCSGKQFDENLFLRKSSIKTIIQQELAKLAEEDEEREQRELWGDACPRI